MTQRTVRDIIEGQELVIAPATVSIGDAARLMKQHRVGAVMVVENDKLAGVFTERDALFRVIAEGRDGQTTTLAEVMTRDPQTIDPDKPFLYALEMMYRGSFRHVPVVENGRPIGIVSARDALGPELETFVYEMLRQEQITEILA
jgi:CBS domain-containing protein